MHQPTRLEPDDFVDLYPTPQPIHEDGHDRLHHLDLEGALEVELMRELGFLRTFNFLVDSEWHREREERIAVELAERRRGRQRARRSA